MELSSTTLHNLLSLNRAEAQVIQQDLIQQDLIQQDLWGRLPCELIEQVLAKLPFSRLLRFCYVCRSWEKFILSARAHSLFRFTAGELLVRNWATGAWEHASLQFLGLQAEQYKSLRLLSSSRGLLCFTDNKYENFQEFIVCNPLTRRYRRLPLRHLFAAKPSGLKLRVCPADGLMGLLADTAQTNTQTNTGHFKLVVLGVNLQSTGAPFTGFVYCSHYDSWTRTAELPEATHRDAVIKVVKREQSSLDSTKNSRPIVEHLGSVFWAVRVHDECTTVAKVRSFLLKYNVELDHWSWTPCPSTFRSHMIFTIPYNGTLACVHNRDDHLEEFVIILKESDSSHTLALGTPPISLSSGSLFENIALKFIPRSDDLVKFLNLFSAGVSFPGGENATITVQYSGDEGTILCCRVGVYSIEEVVKSVSFDEGERSKWIPGMDNSLKMSRLVTSDVNKWGDGFSVYNNGGVFTPILEFCN